MQENEFHHLADLAIKRISDALDALDERGTLEAEIAADVLTITLPGGKQFIVNKHAPSRQLWLASPVSGGLHFSCDIRDKQWKLMDGRSLFALLAEELEALAGVSVTL